jgi:hypothetical protein
VSASGVLAVLPSVAVAAVPILEIDDALAMEASDAMDVRAGSERRRSTLVSAGRVTVSRVNSIGEIGGSSADASFRYWCSSASDSLSFYTKVKSTHVVSRLKGEGRTLSRISCSELSECW